MQTFRSARNLLLATSAMVLLAACVTDSGSSSSGGSGGGGSTPSSVPQVGLTGTGGTTEALGVAALTDPILGTDGALGGGGTGLLGSAIPADQLAPLSSALDPVVTQVASALPLDTVTSQIPALGVDGSGGVVQDLTGQDPLTDVIGTTGVLGTVTGGGNGVALGDIIPAGTVPSLPTGSLPSIQGLSSITSGDPAATITNTLDTATALVTGATGGASSGGDPLAPVTGALDTVTSTVTGATGGASSPLAPVTGALGTVTSTLGTVTSALP